MRSFVVGIFIFLFFVSSVFASYPQRIISGMPSITEMLFALGLGKRVVGVTTNCNYPPSARKKERVGGFFLNLEKIVSLDPDLIIMLENAQRRDIKKFKEFGLPVYTINPQSVEDVLETLLELGELTGTKAKAKEIVGKMEERLQSLGDRIGFIEPEDELIDSMTTLSIGEQKYSVWELEGEENRGALVEVVQYHVLNIRPPKVLVIVGFNPLIVAGGGTLIDDMISYAGAENIAKKAEAAFPQYSFETLLKENPDYIIIPEGTVRRREIEKDRRWQSLGAVENGKILYINADILSRPGPRVVEAIEKMADFIYQ